MKKQNIEIRVPTKVEDIRLGQYQEYLELHKTVDENQKLTQSVRNKVVSIFCDVPFKLVQDHFSAEDVDEVFNGIMKLLTELLAKANSGDQFNLRFKVGDVEFGFEPEFTKMKAGAFADLSDYYEDWNTMHRAMAVLYRPVAYKKRNWFLKIEQYELEPYTGTTKYGDAMKAMPALKALEAAFFLTNSSIELERLFQTYSQSLLKKMTLEQKEEHKDSLSQVNKFFSTNGGGIKLSTQLLMGTHSKWMKSLTSPL